MRKTVFLAAALAVLLVPGTVANHCSKAYLDRDSEELRIMDPETGQVRYYVEEDCTHCRPGDVAIWIYEETNGYPNLQRYDTFRGATTDDTCHGKIRPDTTVA